MKKIDKKLKKRKGKKKPVISKMGVPKIGDGVAVTFRGEVLKRWPEKARNSVGGG